jgi:uncharacterized membrane protein (UPF0127 family)
MPVGSSVKDVLGGRSRLPATLSLVAVVLLATWMGAMSGGYFVAGWAPPFFLLSALMVAGLASGAFRAARLRYAAIALALFGAYTLWTFASILWSPNRGDAWFGAGLASLYLLALCLTVALILIGASRRWVLTAAAVGPSVLAGYTLRSLVASPGDLFENSRLIGTVGYYNGEAAFLLVPFWTTIYVAGSRRVPTVLRAIVLAGAALSADVAVLTQSRGAMVAMAVSLPIFFVFSGQRLRGVLALVPVAAAVLVAFPGLNEVYLAFLNGGNPAAAVQDVSATVWLTAAAVGVYGALWGIVDRWWTPSPTLTRVAGAFAVAGAVLVIAVSLFVFAERAGSPVAFAQQKWEAFKADDRTGEEQSRYLSASGQGRYSLWQVAWEDFASNPVLGVGTQNFEATYYQLRDDTGTGSVRQPHSLPLEVLCERGIIGGGLFFGFLFVCVGASVRGRLGRLSSEGKAQAGALIAAVTYWFVHSGFDWFWQLPAVTLPAMVYLAMLVTPWRRDETAPLRPSLRALGVGVAVLFAAAIIPLYAADRYLAQSFRTEDPGEAQAAVQRAETFNPLDQWPRRREAELATAAGDGERAEAALNAAIRLNPEHYASYVLMARYYEQNGRARQALQPYQSALALNPLSAELNRQAIDLLPSVLGERAAVRVVSNDTERLRLDLEVAKGATKEDQGVIEPRGMPADADGFLFASSTYVRAPFARADAPEAMSVAFVNGNGKILAVDAIGGPADDRRSPPPAYRLAVVAGRDLFEKGNIRAGDEIVLAGKGTRGMIRGSQR